MVHSHTTAHMRALTIAMGMLLIVGGAAHGQPADDTSPPDAVVQTALQTAADALGVSTDDLSVVAAEQRDWPDSSLGCPQPGLAYSQIVTPGWLVTVDTSNGASEVQVHTDMASRGVIC